MASIITFEAWGRREKGNYAQTKKSAVLDIRRGGEGKDPRKDRHQRQGGALGFNGQEKKEGSKRAKNEEV